MDIIIYRAMSSNALRRRNCYSERNRVRLGEAKNIRDPSVEYSLRMTTFLHVILIISPLCHSEPGEESD